MHFYRALAASFLATGALAGPLQARQAWGPTAAPSQTWGSAPTDTPSSFGQGDGNGHSDSHGLEPICRGLNTQDHGCVRYTRGFDVTGVVTEVYMTFPLVQNVCDCIQQCLARPTTCATYVYKFSTPTSVLSGHRTCTLYSQFNLPAAVVLEFNLNSTLDANINAAEIIQLGNNPQAGAPVPQAFKDVNLDTTPDNNAFSGHAYYCHPIPMICPLTMSSRPVWQLASGATQC